MKVKTYLNTKCTPCRPFVKRFEELLKGAHPYILMKIMNKLQFVAVLLMACEAECKSASQK